MIYCQVFLNCFTMTFIAEWGDRSQLATIVLAGMNNVWGVIVGQCQLELSTGLFTMLLEDPYKGLLLVKNAYCNFTIKNLLR